MKYKTRIHINNFFIIPRYIIKNYVKDNNMVKWIINKKEKKIKLIFITGDKNKKNDSKTDDCIILYRIIHTNMHLSIPIDVAKCLKCKKYDFIEWNVDNNEINIKCSKNIQIKEISGLFLLEVEK